MSSPPPPPRSSSSSPSAPLDQFESLSIESKMSLTSAEIRTRAIEIRDVLSSFDRDILPSEFKPQIFAELDRPFQSRPPVTQWTIQEDLSATLLQWGAYNDEAWEFLIQLQSKSTLARCFHEKLGRRFDELLEQYDRLADEDQEPRQAEIEKIAQGFRNVVDAVRDDRAYREMGQDSIAKRLLEAMINICRRHTNNSTQQTASIPVRSARALRSSAPTTEGSSNLYEALIQNPARDQLTGPFMLDVLETFPGSVFNKFESEYANLVSLLDTNNAPTDYRYRVGRLPSRSVSKASQAAVSARSSSLSSAGPSTSSAIATKSDTQSLTQPQAPKASKAGSKRRAEEVNAPGRRGKKKAT